MTAQPSTPFNTAAMAASSTDPALPAGADLYTLRPARPDDVPALVGLITELAEFENLTHLLSVTPETLAPHLFGEKPVVESWVAEHQSGEVVAFALTFINFSTFLAKPGLYLEDLYVKPAHRGAGLGRRMLTLLAGIANQRGYGRFEWCVLDWNENAIRFYEKMGAALLPDWRLCRLSGEALQRYAP
jgi:ribosomal protein S18 acetylase RimI-like enzyme